MWECVMKLKWGQLKTKLLCFLQYISTLWKQEGVDVKRIKENGLKKMVCLVLIIDFKCCGSSTKLHTSKLKQFWSWRSGWDRSCVFKIGTLSCVPPFCRILCLPLRAPGSWVVSVDCRVQLWWEHIWKIQFKTCLFWVSNYAQSSVYKISFFFQIRKLFWLKNYKVYSMGV